MKLKLKAGTTSTPLPSPNPLAMLPNQPAQDTEATGRYSNTFAGLRYGRGNTLLPVPCIADSQCVHTRHVGLERRSGRCLYCSTTSGHVL
jgi:hypothetical protein